MAQIFPPLEEIRKSKYEEGELYLLEFLQNNLNDSFEVYFQPFLNGDNPDIIVMRKNSGVLIIEVKDWHLSSYYLDGNAWHLRQNDAHIKSPISQVEAYKENLYYLHIDRLLEQKVLSPKLWAIVSCVVYFHNETTDTLSGFFQNRNLNDNYTKLLGRNSLEKVNFTNLLYDLGLGRHSRYFDDDLYASFKRYLQPPLHSVEKGLIITYTNEQKPLIISESRQQKILGVAGSGKTYVLSKRAVNAHLRTRNKVLILTFNITLRNYIHDRISEVRENFGWSNFYITYYHLFFVNEANNHNLPIKTLTEFDNEDFFESVKGQINKYEAIFIDEIQDYQANWVKIIRKYFLADGGEFVVFGDEKQNVYHRELEIDKRPYTGISGQWKKLNECHRLRSKMVGLASQFQKHFLQKKYDVDEIQMIQGEFNLGGGAIKYLALDGDISPQKICETIVAEIKNLNVHPNDVAILSLSIGFLRELDYCIRNYSREKTNTAFETKEMWEAVKKVEDLPQEIIEKEIEKIRRGMKFNFWANRGTLKLSTIHSFKGWEVDTLFLIIENNGGLNENDGAIETEELIYTGITRCRRNLVIINLENSKYHEFFSQNNGLFL